MTWTAEWCHKVTLTSMLTGSMVLIWTLGAEDERSRWPNWLRWSSSLGLKLGGMGMDLDGDTVVWHIDLGRGRLSVDKTENWLSYDLLRMKTCTFILRLTQWSQMGGVMGRPQTQGWFPLRRPPPGWTGDARRTLTLATSCRAQIIKFIHLFFTRFDRCRNDLELNKEKNNKVMRQSKALKKDFFWNSSRFSRGQSPSLHLRVG